MHVDKAKTLKLLKTVKGQIEGLIKMVEEDRYCIDISTQILASQSILKKVNLDILRGHFMHCIKDSFENGEDIETKMQEVVSVMDKMMK